jgi:hypothetical protein
MCPAGGPVGVLSTFLNLVRLEILSLVLTGYYYVLGVGGVIAGVGGSTSLLCRWLLHTHNYTPLVCMIRLYMNGWADICMRSSSFSHRRFIVVPVFSRAGSYLFSQYSYVHERPRAIDLTPLVDQK